MQALVVILVLFCLQPVFAFDFSPYEVSGPTRSAKMNYYVHKKPEYYANWRNSLEARRSLIVNSWAEAKDSEDTASRLYLYALALDVYRTLPAGSFCGECTIGENPEHLKGEIWGDIIGEIEYHGSSVSDAWIMAVQAGTESRKATGYIKAYIRDRIGLERYDVEPSLDVNVVDLMNPTHYAGMSRWMAEQATAMTNNIPPWEAVTWTTQHCGEWQGCDKLSDWSVPVTAASTVTAPTIAVPVSAVPSESAPEVPADTTDTTIPQARLVSRSYGWLWGVVILVAVALGGAVVVRRRKT